MTSIFYALLASLAIWRLTYDVINLEGPFGLYEWMRNFVKDSQSPAWVKNGMTCYHCLSFWIGFVVCLGNPGLSWQSYFLVSLGCSGAVTLTARYLKAMYSADIFE